MTKIPPPNHDALFAAAQACAAKARALCNDTPPMLAKLESLLAGKTAAQVTPKQLREALCDFYEEMQASFEAAFDDDEVRFTDILAAYPEIGTPMELMVVGALPKDAQAMWLSSRGAVPFKTRAQ
jgi:hypothetical protein